MTGVILSWLAAVPGSIASGSLLGAPVSKGTKAGSFIFIFLTSLFVSMDLASRAGAKIPYVAAMTVMLSLAAYLPWVLTIDKPAKNTSRAAALSISGVLYSVIMLAFAGIMGTDSLSTKLQGGVITLMYVLISTSLGYQSVRAKKDPVARAQTIYMTGLLVLITMFDLLGAARATGNASQPATNSNSNAKPEPEAAANAKPAANAKLEEMSPTEIASLNATQAKALTA